MKTRDLLVIPTLIVLASGCAVRTDLDEWKPELAAPLIVGEATLGDIVNLFDSTGWLRTEPDGQFFLHYETELALIGSPDLFDIPDFSDNYDTAKTETNFPLFALEKGIIGDGKLFYRAGYSRNRPAELVVDFDNLFEPGGLVPFQYRDTFNGPGIYTGEIQLGGLELTPDNLNLSGRYSISDLQNGNTYRLDSLHVSFTDLRLHYAEGYFPGYDFALDSGLLATNLTLPEGLPFPVLTNPAIELVVENEFGIPNELQATRLTFVYPTGNRIDLVDPYLTQGFSLGYPTVPGEKATTSIRLDRTNSNLDDLVADIPDSIAYAGILRLFPDSIRETGFVIDTATVTVNLIADFPLEFRAEPWEWEQWFPWDSLGWDEGGTAQFRLETTNGMPVEAFLELYAADQDSNLVLPFFSQPLTIQAPSLTSSGAVETPAEEVRFLDVSPDLLELLTRTPLVYARLRLATPMNGTRSIQLFSHDRFSFKLGVRYQP